MDILIEFFDFANEVTLVNGTPDLVGVDRPPATVETLENLIHACIVVVWSILSDNRCMDERVIQSATVCIIQTVVGRTIETIGNTCQCKLSLTSPCWELSFVETSEGSKTLLTIYNVHLFSYWVSTQENTGNRETEK